MSNTPQQGERTSWSAGLVGFYLGCAAVSVGAAIAAAGWIVFGNATALAVGLVMIIAGSIACLRCLRAARRE